MASIGTILMRTQGQAKYKALSRRLKESGRRDLQRKLNKAIRNEGAAALAEAQAAWSRVDVLPRVGHGPKSTNLRARTADATRISILQNGIRIRVEGKRIDPRYGTSLAWNLDGLPRGRPWRHPVFGNQRVWVEQRGQEVFFRTLLRHEHSWRAGIERAMDETARQIEG